MSALEKTNREIANEVLREIQKNFLKIRYGFDYEKKILKLNKFNDEKFGFYNFIERLPQSKNDLTEDEKYEIEAKLKGYFLDCNFLNTSYEPFDLWHILNCRIEKIKTVIQNQEIENKDFFFGIVMSGEVNAEIRPIQDTNIKLLLMQSEMFICANLLCKIIAQSLPFSVNESNRESILLSYKPERLQEKLSTEREPVKRFLDLFFNAIHKKPSSSEPYLLKSDFIESIHGYLLESLECFVIGHEFGHVIWNHLEGCPRIAEFPSDSGDVLRIILEQNQEYEADQIGAEIIFLLDVKKGSAHFPFSVLGPDIILNFYHYRDKFHAENFMSGESPHKTMDEHPPSFQRKERIRQIILTFYSEKDQEILHKMYRMIDAIFEKFINEYETFHATRSREIWASLLFEK